MTDQMQRLTLDDTAELLGVLKVNWPEQEIDDKRIALYHTTLADLPYAAVLGAAWWWIAEEKWLPKPGELRTKAEALLGEGQIRWDSYARRVGLERAVGRALDTGQPLALGAGGAG